MHNSLVHVGRLGAEVSLVFKFPGYIASHPTPQRVNGAATFLGLSHLIGIFSEFLKGILDLPLNKDLV